MASTSVGSGLDHGHLHLDATSIEVLVVEPDDCALRGGWVVVGDGGLALLLAGRVVAVDPDLELACLLVSLDDTD
jgi:hypothetical protein